MWQDVDLVAAFLVGAVVATLVARWASRRQLRIEPLLSSAIGRAFLLALLWLLVFSVAFTLVRLPYVER